jgi:hypothetical protein
MFRTTFLHEVFNYGRFYEFAENYLDIPAMFPQIINNVFRKIIPCPNNSWSTTVWDNISLKKNSYII